MKYLGDILLEKGKAPIRMEPVKATIQLKREGSPTVHILDHDGNQTGETVEVSEEGAFTVEGAKTKAVYYEITY